LIDSLKENWNEITLESKKKFIQTIFEAITIECIQSHGGGRDQKAVIEIVDYKLK